MLVRKLASAAAAASICAAAVFGVAAPVNAQEYPPAGDVAISDTTVVAGQTVTVTAPAGSFEPETTVTVTVPDLGVSGTTTAAADGGATFTFEVPDGAQPGVFEVVLTGAGGETVTVPFEVVAAAGPAPVQADDEQDQGSALPRTGADDVIPLTIAGVSLVALGGGLVVAARRRRDALPAGVA